MGAMVIFAMAHPKSHALAMLRHVQEHPAKLQHFKQRLTSLQYNHLQLCHQIQHRALAGGLTLPAFCGKADLPISAWHGCRRDGAE